MRAADKHALLLEQIRRAGEACNTAARGLLNCGGCAEFAATLAERLQELGWQVGAVTGDDEHEPSVDEIRKSLANNADDIPAAEAWYANGVSFHHVLAAVKLGRQWFMVDSENAEPFEPDHEQRDPTLGYYVRKGLFTWQEMRRIYDTGSWNHSYPRHATAQVRRLIRRYVTLTAGGLVAE